jgi:hypothetical protein
MLLIASTLFVRGCLPHVILRIEIQPSKHSLQNRPSFGVLPCFLGNVICCQSMPKLPSKGVICRASGCADGCRRCN